MLGLLKRLTMADVIAEDGIPHSRFANGGPKPISIVFDDLPDLTEYREIAKELGFVPQQIHQQERERDRRKLIGFMLDQGMPIYDNAEVHAYMSKLAAAHDKFFAWAVVGDKRHPHEIRHIAGKTYSWTDMNGERHMDEGKPHGAMAGVYKQAIPLHILKRAAAVKKEFTAAGIFASDYAVAKPDPFIAAKLHGCEHVVFGAWDEPGFGLIGRDRDQK